VLGDLGLDVSGETVPYVAGWGEDGALEAVTQFAHPDRQMRPRGGTIRTIRRDPDGYDTRVEGLVRDSRVEVRESLRRAFDGQQLGPWHRSWQHPSGNPGEAPQLLLVRGRARR
jgi:hypothetical protein